MRFALLVLALLGTASPALARDRVHYGVPKDSALFAELDATIGRLEQGKAIEGRHFAIVRVLGETDGGTEVELMDVRIEADPVMETAGSIGMPFAFLGPLMLFFAVPVVVDGGEDMDTGTVKFLRTGHRLVVEDAPPLGGIHALWLRPVGDDRFSSEVVPFGSGPLDLTGIAPPRLAARTRVPSVTAVAYWLRLGVAPLKERETRADEIIERLRAQVEDRSVDRAADRLALARLLMHTASAPAEAFAHYQQLPGVREQTPLTLEAATAAYTAGLHDDAWELVRETLDSDAPLAAHLCGLLTSEVPAAAGRCPQPKARERLAPQPIRLSTDVLFRRKAEELAWRGEQAMLEFRMEVDGDLDVVLRFVVALAEDADDVEVFFHYNPIGGGWKRVRMTRTTDLVRTFEIPLEHDIVGPCLIYLKAFRRARLVGRYASAFQPDEITLAP